MVKNIVFSAVVLSIGVLVAGAIFLAGAPKAQATTKNGTITPDSCRNVCVWDARGSASLCWVDCAI